ncbi:hypothetical protein [Acanthopleuribacter pedis]|uniref:Uncharacterized protein n=1 Tax=Acanthopleuribacter pedis TaxID=442870 RepID=A0A8J7U2J3_9BACT|nr:hypothetical protein [Acanthopleuribacter pedis]MBO1319383.1 hypothetical protein [Acanthopleuribacter pedis]
MLDGAVNGSLQLTVTEAETGVYRCEVTGPRGTFVSTPTEITLDTLTGMRVTPRVQTLGDTVPTFTVAGTCSLQNPQYEWTAFPATTLNESGNQVSVDPPPQETTRLDVTVTEGADQVTVSAWLLVAAHPGFDDFNGDGCQNVQDLRDLAPFWRQAFEGDLSGDGRIDVLDLLYLQVVDPVPCPPQP